MGLSAITDSNKLLREERDRLKTIVGQAQEQAAKADEAVKPLELKLKELEERAGTLAVEKAALQTEADRWKQRANQLIEKNHKVNPDELKKLQESRAPLGKELETVRQALLASQQEGKRKDREIQEKNMENSKLSQQNVQGKNATSNMNKTINE